MAITVFYYHRKTISLICSFCYCHYIFCTFLSHKLCSHSLGLQASLPSVSPLCRDAPQQGPKTPTSLLLGIVSLCFSPCAGITNLCATDGCGTFVNSCPLRARFHAEMKVKVKNKVIWVSGFLSGRWSFHPVFLFSWSGSSTAEQPSCLDTNAGN